MLRLWWTAGRATPTAMKSINNMTVARLTATSAPQRLITPVGRSPGAGRPGTLGSGPGGGVFFLSPAVFLISQRYLESAWSASPCGCRDADRAEGVNLARAVRGPYPARWLTFPTVPTVLIVPSVRALLGSATPATRGTFVG